MRSATLSLAAILLFTGITGFSAFFPGEAPAEIRRPGITLFGTPEVEMKERPDAYEIEIPINQPEDGENIQARIEPKLIIVSGKYVIGSQAGFMGTMSFHRTFRPEREVLPETQKRAVKDGKLIISVDKKYPGPVENTQPLPPDLEQELKKAKPLFI